MHSNLQSINNIKDYGAQDGKRTMMAKDNPCIPNYTPSVALKTAGGLGQMSSI